MCIKSCTNIWLNFIFILLVMQKPMGNVASDVQ